MRALANIPPVFSILIKLLDLIFIYFLLASIACVLLCSCYYGSEFNDRSSFYFWKTSEKKSKRTNKLLKKLPLPFVVLKQDMEPVLWNNMIEHLEKENTSNELVNQSQLSLRSNDNSNIQITQEVL